jgi:hypothetical protein
MELLNYFQTGIKFLEKGIIMKINHTKMKINFILCFLGIIFCMGCLKYPIKNDKEAFELFVENYKVIKTDGYIPVPQKSKMPDYVYKSALQIKEQDPRLFKELICLYLLKYHLYYLENCRQSYSFLSLDEEELINPKDNRNTPYFFINKFMEMSGERISNNDAIPSNSVLWYCKENLSDSGKLKEIIKRIELRRKELERQFKESISNYKDNE